jgi:hypothetical protein
MEKWQREFVRLMFRPARSRADVEAAILAKHPHIPRFLYKYKEFSDNHKGALMKGVLRTSSPDCFNDPFDTGLYFEPDRFLVEDLPAEEFMAMAKREMEDSKKGTSTPRPLNRPIQRGELRRKLAHELLHKLPSDQQTALMNAIDALLVELTEKEARATTAFIRQQHGVLSLAENSTSILMWSHYAKNHRGFCIEYDFGALDPGAYLRRFCFPVLYRRRLPDVTPYLSPSDPPRNNMWGIYTCITKNDEWAYEREWRYVQPFGIAPANGELAMPKPSAILLGALVERDDEEWMREFCADTGIPLKRMAQRYDAFRLEIQDVAYPSASS